MSPMDPEAPAFPPPRLTTTVAQRPTTTSMTTSNVAGRTKLVLSGGRLSGMKRPISRETCNYDDDDFDLDWLLSSPHKRTRLGRDKDKGLTRRRAFSNNPAQPSSTLNAGCSTSTKRSAPIDQDEYQEALDIVLQKTLEDKNTAEFTVARLEGEKEQQAEELKQLKERVRKLETEQRKKKEELTSKTNECRQLRTQLAASETQATQRLANMKKLLADISSQIDTALLPQAADTSS